MIYLRETLATLRRESHTRALLIRTVFWFYPVCWIALWLTARVLRDRGEISAPGYEALVRVNLLLALVLALVVSYLLNLTVEGVATKIATGGSTPRGPTFSLEDSLLAKGEFGHARETLVARLEDQPGDIPILLKLADLDARWGKDAVAAERWYLAARGAGPDRDQLTAIGNGLIDLYRATGQSGRLMTELARFSQAHAATRAGREALRELREMKQDLPT